LKRINGGSEAPKALDIRALGKAMGIEQQQLRALKVRMSVS